jgi:hypothetical protein
MNPHPSSPQASSPISEHIVVVRGRKVILDSDLAELYGVPTKRLNEQVRSNSERFPPDFMFLLTSDEWDSVKSHIAASRSGSGQRRRFLPYVFTVHGALMAAGLLNTPQAIEVSILIARGLVEMREGDDGPFGFLAPKGD